MKKIMAKVPEAPIHPGLFIKQTILPPGLSIKDTANRLEIAPSTLSRLLKGKAQLTPEIANRFESEFKEFGADRKDLLKRQEAYDRSEMRIHPGVYIKNEVIPKKLSVKDAAKLLGVGRPALSNLLNGNASLSEDMASRLEKVFGVDSQKLLERKAHFDQRKIEERKKEISVKTLPQNFLDIKARDIEDWADNIEARSLLPAFVRKLVNTTGKDFLKVDFPAYDNAQRHGWDGEIETDSATQWIPKGRSGWEFGVDKNPKRKAEEDFAMRTKSFSLQEREQTSFVFVTPRNWPGKTEWLKAKKIKSDWLDVRAYDASDLEQWLEQSIPAQIWFAENLNIHDDNIQSLDQCWHKWASDTTPEITKMLFSDSVGIHKNTLEQWLTKLPERPLIVAAESRHEALAFLACAFEEIGSLPSDHYDQVVAVFSGPAMQKVTQVDSTFTLIAASKDAELKIAGAQKRQHTIIVRHKGSMGVEADISLDIPTYEAFRKSLLAMGIDQQEIGRYSRESGQSPTILRRRLSQIPAIKHPPWLQDDKLARKLIPLILSGRWDKSKKSDRDILSYLADVSSYEDIEKSIAEILKFDESPVWALGENRGVISKIDAIFLASGSITQYDIDRFFFTAEMVLSEDDPALDLPENDRWASALYQKTRDHSKLLRERLCETLALLSVHGNQLLQARLGLNVETAVSNLIHKLLTPFQTRTWLSQQNDLPGYAEAAPEEFIAILESDLNSDNPKVLALLEPVKSAIFGGCTRTGLLWAVELLAWKPERLVRIVVILAKLAKNEIKDNWTNKPINSLKSIFRAWMPQTAATIEQRKSALEFLAKKFPEIGWKICIDQFDRNSTIGHYNYRPKWRNDASGVGQPIYQKEAWEFRRKALDIALAWPRHNEKTLGDLVERFSGMSEEDVKKVWSLISNWTFSQNDDTTKDYLRDRIRRCTMVYRKHKMLNEDIRKSAYDAYACLTPKDLIVRHQWLFSKRWVELAFEVDDEEVFSRQRVQERVEQLRESALTEIWKERETSGVKELLRISNAANAIGRHLAKSILDFSEIKRLLHELISDFSLSFASKLEHCSSGILAEYGPNERKQLIHSLIKQFKLESVDSQRKIIRLLKCAPLQSDTWLYLAELGQEIEHEYWLNIIPDWTGQEGEELNYFINKLLEVNRPREAFWVAHWNLEDIGSEQILNLLTKLAVKESEPDAYYRIESYDLAKAFKILNERGDISSERLAQLEFQYLAILRYEEEIGIPNLERQISQTPHIFVQALALAYKRSDDGEDPLELLGFNIENRQALALAGHSLLKKIKQIPGTNVNGKINPEKLSEWLSEVRSLCCKYAREVIGDQEIGQLLSVCPIGDDGIWPCEPLRPILEDIASNDMALGISIGLKNSEGATWRGEGEPQERVLAQQYHTWAKQIAFEYPFVSNLVEKIAQSYERTADYWDTDSNLRRRIGY